MSVIALLFGVIVEVFLHPRDFHFPHHGWSFWRFSAFAVTNVPTGFIFAGLAAFAFPSKWWLVVQHSFPYLWLQELLAS